MFRRFFDEGLAQSSYLVACARTGEAAVVDPRRDVQVYTTAAAQHGLNLSYAIETHIHADFLSGARELASTGARVVAGPAADLQHPFIEARHRDSLQVGDLVLEWLHTPGHTPEHISILVREPGAAVRVLTGDTLFVGAVGRPDLLGEDQAAGLAAQLYDKEPFTTIGQERRFNPLLQQRSKADFVRAVLDDLPETPPYFPRMKRVNRNGPPLRALANGVPAPRPLAARDAVAAVEDGAVLIDLRSPEAFGSGHPSGAINIGFGPRIGYWAGWIVPQGVRLVLLGSDRAHVDEANVQLLRVGFDDVVGFVDGGYDAWRAGSGPVSRVDLISARELRNRLSRREPLTLVDVRTTREWRTEHIDEAINIPVGDLPERATELQGNRPVATICESGFRSSLASSVLLRAGVHVINVSDGTSAYRALEGA
jgi:hydroxyacylglutathione hydrolase